MKRMFLFMAFLVMLLVSCSQSPAIPDPATQEYLSIRNMTGKTFYYKARKESAMEASSVSILENLQYAFIYTNEGDVYIIDIYTESGYETWTDGSYIWKEKKVSDHYQIEISMDSKTKWMEITRLNPLSYEFKD